MHQRFVPCLRCMREKSDSGIVSDKAILRQGLACNYFPYIKVCRQTGNDLMLLNLVAERKRLSGAERSAEMEHLIHFSQKVTS